MLCLTRKNGEVIFIDRHIKITVRQHGKDTRVTIDAPKSVPILRGELVKKEMKDAA